MNRRLLTVLLVAFVIAAICTFGVYRLVSGRMTAAQPVPTTNVVAAKTDIKLGTLLTADNLTTIGLTGEVPKGAVLAKDKNNVLGRGVISDLYAGEPIIDSRLAAPGSGGGLAPKIPLGMRACAVRVDDVVDVSGFVTPDMRVDVLISGTPPGVTNPTEGTVARTLFQNLQVLSAGTEYQKDAEGKAKPVGVVNLLVTPEQAEALSLATNQTKIQLVLRNPLDTKIATVAGTATNSLYADPNAPAVKQQPRRVAAPKARAAAPQAFSIEVINGSKQSQEKFASPGGHQ
jgi:pilus assembly protein CpaB